MTNIERRSTPPFLNSFNASATILSYVGNTLRVVDILNSLSKSTTQYLEGHTQFLNKFVKGPQIPTAAILHFDKYEKINLGRNW